GPAEEDFRRSSALIYRGSSSVLYGILRGLLPINLQLPGMIDTDPIYQLDAWRKTCSTPAQLQALLKAHEQRSAEDRHQEWNRAAAYVNSYIVPVKDENLESFLNAVGIERTFERCTA